MTALLVPEGGQIEALAGWDQTLQELGKPAKHVAHWKNFSNHNHRKHLVHSVANVTGAQLISVVLCKWHLPNASGLRHSGRLYNWTLRLMLERLSAFGAQHGEMVSPTFAQVGGQRKLGLDEYIAKLENAGSILWDRIEAPKIATPDVRRMLQLADAASGAAHAAFEADQWGRTEQSYLRTLQPIVWHRPNCRVWYNGLKFGPWPYPCEQEHPWFKQFCLDIEAGGHAKGGSGPP